MSNLMSGLLISSLGGGLFLYGKKMQRLPALLAGLAMCIYPFFIGSVILMWILTMVLLGALWMTRQS